MKTRRIIFVAAWMACVFSAGFAASENAPGVDGSTLLMATFEGGFEADYARKERNPLRTGGAELKDGFRGRGVYVPPGALGVAYGRNGLDPRRGTTEFRFKAVTRMPVPQNPGRAFGLFSTETPVHSGMAAYIAWNRCIVFRTAEAYRSLSRLEGAESAYNDGAWHHFAFTWDEDALQYFLDGKLQSVSPGASRFSRQGDRGEFLLGYLGPDELERRRNPAALVSSAEGVFDDVRISDAVRYVADFVPPGPGFSGPASATISMYPEARETKASGSEGPIFILTFENGFEPAVWRTARRVMNLQGAATVADWAEGHGLQLATTKPAGVVAYNVGDMLNRFLGTVSLAISPESLPAQRVTVLDLTDARGTGMTLLLRPDGGLTFALEEARKPLTEVASPPLAWTPASRRVVRVDWSTAELRLVIDGAVTDVARQVVMPSRMGATIRIGGSRGGRGGFCGRVDDIRVFGYIPKDI